MNYLAINSFPVNPHGNLDLPDFYYILPLTDQTRAMLQKKANITLEAHVKTREVAEIAFSITPDIHMGSTLRTLNASPQNTIEGDLAWIEPGDKWKPTPWNNPTQFGSVDEEEHTLLFEVHHLVVQPNGTMFLRTEISGHEEYYQSNPFDMLQVERAMKQAGPESTDLGQLRLKWEKNALNVMPFAHPANREALTVIAEYTAYCQVLTYMQTGNQKWAVSIDAKKVGWQDAVKKVIDRLDLNVKP